MKIISLEPPLYDYLLHVIKSYAGAGIDPDEGFALHSMWQAVKTPLDTAELTQKVPPAQNSGEGLTMEDAQ